MKLDKRSKMDEMMSTPLKHADPELHSILAAEKARQQRGLGLVASENLASGPILETLSSCLTNKYCEGLPKPRDRGSNKYLDRIEHMCQERALQAFNLPPAEWGVNVQPYSGTPANMAVYTALLSPHDRIMCLDVPDGGHLSHGYMTSEKRVSATSVYFETMAYKVDANSGLIDYDKLAENARMFKPKLIIAGSSSHPRCMNYKKFRQIANENGAYLVADIAQVAGLVQAGVIPSPFQHCDVVVLATHHTLRGPRAGVIFFRKGIKSVSPTGEVIKYDLEDKVGQGVFPMMHQGPGLLLAGRSDQIAGVAIAFRQAQSPQFKEYQRQIVKNAKAMCAGLQRRGYKIVSDGTDVHMLLVDLRPTRLSGAEAEYMLEKVSITCNKNPVPGDTDLENPNGIRLGTPTLTTRGLVERHMQVVVEFIHRALEIALDAHALSQLDKTDFKRVLVEDKLIRAEMIDLRKEVEDFADHFPMTSLHKL